MSRLVRQPILVEIATAEVRAVSAVSAEAGIANGSIVPVLTPSVLRLWDGRVLPVAGVMDYFREWLGVLEGEGERDIWLLDTAAGPCEVHYLRPQVSVGVPITKERMENYNIKEGEERGIRFDTWLLHAWLD